MVDRAAHRARLTIEQHRRVAYLLQMMGSRAWFPSITGPAVDLLGRCDSQLERLYLLGLVRQMDTRRQSAGYGAMLVFEHCGRWALDLPFLGFRHGRGPLSMTVRPQLPRARLIYDFGLYFSGRLAMAVEVDGYALHRKQRRWDSAKSRRLAVPVVRVLEELDEPSKWAGDLLDWTRDPCSHCGEHIQREHSCPPF